MEKYSIAYLNKLNKSKNGWLIVSISVTIIAFGFFILSCFLVNDKNLYLLIAIDAIILSICLIFSLFSILNIVLPKINIARHIQKVLSRPKENKILKVEHVDKKVTYSKDVLVIPMLLSDEETNKIYYLDIDNEPNSFAAGDILEIECADNFILKATRNEK